MDMLTGKNTYKHLITWWVMVFIMFSSVTCSNNSYLDDVGFNVPGVPDGKWKVEKMVVGSDLTADYANYVFQFFSNGTISATRSGIVSWGNWDENLNSFWFDFGPNDPFRPFNKDWTITTRTTTIIRLKGATPSEVLHMVKF
jgi:hypothetical protein